MFYVGFRQFQQLNNVNLIRNIYRVFFWNRLKTRRVFNLLSRKIFDFPTEQPCSILLELYSNLVSIVFRRYLTTAHSFLDDICLHELQIYLEFSSISQYLHNLFMLISRLLSECFRQNFSLFLSIIS